MVNGSPDYTKRVYIMGSFAGTNTPVAVDEDGQLFAILKGTDGDTLVPVKVDSEGRIVAVMTGSDGESSTEILTDASGRMITVIQDPVSGEYAKLDADGYFLMKIIGDKNVNVAHVDTAGNLQMLMTGLYGEEYRTVLLDNLGRITAIMVGSEDGTQRQIAVDDGGRIIGVFRDPDSDNYLGIDSDGFLSSVMKGLDDDTLRTVAVDSDGNILGVFKGEYEGSLKTLATDATGRLIAKLVDLDDVLGDEVTVGNAELAARLGSSMIWSRTGTLASLWDGSHGLSGVLTQANETGSEIVLVASITETAGYAAKLVAANHIDAFAWMQLSGMVVGYAGIVAAEFHWLPQTGDVEHFFYINVYDGTNVSQYRLSWDDVDNKILYKNSAGNYVDSGFTMNPSKNAYSFNGLKLFVDTENQEYVKVIENVASNSLASIGCYITADAAPPRVDVFYVLSQNSAGGEGKSYLDRMIITVNE